MSSFVDVCDTATMHGYLSELKSSVMTTYTLPLVPPTQGSVASPQANTSPSFHSSTSSVTNAVSFTLLPSAARHHLMHTHTNTHRVHAHTQRLSTRQTLAYLICHSSKHMHTDTHLSDYLIDKHGDIKPYSSWLPSRRRKNNFPQLAQHEYKGKD